MSLHIIPQATEQIS